MTTSSGRSSGGPTGSRVLIAIKPDHLPSMKLAADFDPHPAFAAALAALGDVAVARYRQAVDALSEAERSSAGFSLLEPVARLAAGEYAGAIAAASSFMSRFGQHPFLCLLMGLCHENLHQAEDARRAYAAALATAAGLADDPRLTAPLMALKALTEIIATSGRAFAGPHTPFIQRAFDRTDFFANYADAARGHIDELIGAFAARPTLPFDSVTAIAVMLGLASVASPSWADTVFDRYAVPAIGILIAANRLGDALRYENVLVDIYGKSRETTAHMRRLGQVLFPLLANAGRDFARARALPHPPPPRLKPRYRVAFVVRRLISLAHVDVLIDIMSAIGQAPRSRLECTLVGVSGDEKPLAARCSANGIRLVNCSASAEKPGTILDLFLATRDFIVGEQFDAVVWVSAATGAGFALALPLAPVQIFFAMKYHVFESPEVDAYLTGGPAGQRFSTIEGRQWRVAQSYFAGLYDPDAAAAAADIRARYGANTLILGCIGREEKMTGSAFLEAVTDVLRRRTDAVFLWTGRKKIDVIQSHFERAGVSDRCHFVGWVDTRVYAQVLDVFLDSFPFPCGVTALQAMAAAKPIVLFDSPEARETGIPVFIQPLLEGSAGTLLQQQRVRELMTPDNGVPTFLFAANVSQYVTYALALAASAGLRARIGSALRTFVAEFVTDPTACGESYGRHIVEVIEDKIAAWSGDPT